MTWRLYTSPPEPTPPPPPSLPRFYSQTVLFTFFFMFTCFFSFYHLQGLKDDLEIVYLSAGTHASAPAELTTFLRALSSAGVDRDVIWSKWDPNGNGYDI